MKNYNPEELIYKYCRGLCSEEERALVESWHLKELYEEKFLPSEKVISIVNERMRKTLDVYIGASDKSYLHTIRLWVRVSGIAALLFIISIVTLFYLKDKKDQVLFTERNAHQNDIGPGGYKAILTLENGKKIKLLNDKPGPLAKQGTIQISALSNGGLLYHGNSRSNSKEILNTLETPRGGQYQIILPDGTKVWLNAASTLTYPTSFIGNYRKVTLQGEAYFEVAKNKDKPFKVQSNHQEIEVLGTRFNVMSYSDEDNTRTTLLEGSISVSKGKYRKIIAPGQESITNNHLSGNLISVATADLEKNMAWKNDEFIFNGENIQNIMKLISRWYDIEVVFHHPPDQTRYWGVVSRFKNISAILKMLQSTGKVRFKIEGRRIHIMN